MKKVIIKINIKWLLLIVILHFILNMMRVFIFNEPFEGWIAIGVASDFLITGIMLLLMRKNR